ncbi:MAG: GntR family transcriptional regulator [Proteobacteria bacterium]|nr:GntR family transcriptional regulator [Pseudomonadota bacterium]
MLTPTVTAPDPYQRLTHLGADGQLSRGDTLADQAYARLHQALITGLLAPEQVLTVRGVAASFGVSLTPVREAIQRLVAARALTIENGRTIRVPRLDLETYREILKIRIELEYLAAKAAAARIPNEEIDALEKIVETHRAAIEAGDAHATLAANTEFHLRMYRASGCTILYGIIESLWLRVGPTLNLLFPQYCGSLVGHEYHMAAIEALRRRDGETLGKAMQDDLTTGAKYLLRLLKP